MKIQVEKLSPVEKKVTVEVEAERVGKEIDRAYASLGKRVKLRGFRPGKAPRAVLERNFREEVEREVVERLVSTSFEEAVRQEDIDAVAPPHVQVAEPGLGAGRSFSYSARVEVKPAIEPKDYRGLEVTRRSPEVTDAMVDGELARLRDSLAQLVPVEGRFDAQKGDWATIDYEGTVAGQPFEGGKAEGALVQVQDGDFFAGDVPQLEGRKLGESFDLDQVFPATFHDENLRNRPARFRVTLKSLKSKLVPSLDDAFAKEVGIEGVESLAALRERIRSDLEKREKRRAEQELHDALVKGALAKNDFDVPPAMVERAIDAMMESTAQRFARQGVDLRQMGLDLPRIRADLREHALLQVKGALLLEAIADREKIEVTADDEKAEIAKRADELGVPVSKLQLRGEARASLRQRIREDKAVALLASDAKYS
ncbi:MAG TPA: trigger factor [Anaeromyxobacteraceae bacterium]|nr:trigger factor [Anaeromyxobacteraceae bacterium]